MCFDYVRMLKIHDIRQSVDAHLNTKTVSLARSNDVGQRSSFRLLTEDSRQQTLGGFCRCYWWSDSVVQPHCQLTCAILTEMECKSDEVLEHLQKQTSDSYQVNQVQPRCRYKFTTINGDFGCGQQQPTGRLTAQFSWLDLKVGGWNSNSYMTSLRIGHSRLTVSKYRQ